MLKDSPKKISADFGHSQKKPQHWNKNAVFCNIFFQALVFLAEIAIGQNLVSARSANTHKFHQKKF